MIDLEPDISVRSIARGAVFLLLALIPAGFLFVALALLQTTARPASSSVRIPSRSIRALPQPEPPRKLKPPVLPKPPVPKPKPRSRPVRDRSRNIRRQASPASRRPTIRPRASLQLHARPRIRVPLSISSSRSVDYVMPPADALFVDDTELSAPEGGGGNGGDRPARRRRSGPYLETEVDRPARTVRRVAPVYPRRARRHRIEGTVSLEVVITAEGQVSDIRLLDPSVPEILADAAIRAVRRWKYRPAMLDGKAVASRKGVRVEFRLEGE